MEEKRRKKPQHKPHIDRYTQRWPCVDGKINMLIFVSTITKVHSIRSRMEQNRTLSAFSRVRERKVSERDGGEKKASNICENSNLRNLTFQYALKYCDITRSMNFHCWWFWWHADTKRHKSSSIVAKTWEREANSEKEKEIYIWREKITSLPS